MCFGISLSVTQHKMRFANRYIRQKVLVYLFVCHPIVHIGLRIGKLHGLIENVSDAIDRREYSRFAGEVPDVQQQVFF